MILELFLLARSGKQRARIEELETRLEALEPPKPVEAEPPYREGPGNGGKLVLVILGVVILLVLIANSGPTETLIYVDGIPVPTPRPMP